MKNDILIHVWWIFNNEQNAKRKDKLIILKAEYDRRKERYNLCNKYVKD